MAHRLLIFFFFCSANLMAQRAVSTSEVLGSAMDKQARSVQRQQLIFLEKTNHELPWVEELELRTETDEMDFSRQEFLFRMSLNSQQERYKQRKLHQQNIQLMQAKDLLVLQDELMNSYFLLAKYFHLQKRRALRAQQQLVIDDKLRVMRRLASASLDFKLDDLIDAEEDFHANEQSLLEMDGELALLATRLGLALQSDANIQLDTNNLLTLSDLRIIFKQLPTTPGANPRLGERQARVGQSKAEYDFEEAGTQRVLDFVQLKYSGRDNLTFGRELSVGMGFNIPIKGSKQLDLNELALERLENEGEWQELQVALAERLQLKRQVLEFLLEKYDLATRQLAESQLSFSLENYPKMADSEPLALLKMKESQLKRQLNLIDTEADIYEAYLDLIDLTGMVVEMPLRNYLTADLELLDK